MKKILGAFLCTMLLAGCGLKVHSPYKILVTDIVMPPEDRLCAPGDEITVSAQGLEADDRIMFEIRWPLSPVSSVMEGEAKGIWGVITSRTASSITFLAPGHYPASKVTVILFRGGDMMSLGKISVSDGELKEAELYGITRCEANKTVIERISHTEATPVMTLGIGRELECAVGTNGAGWIYGLYSGSAVGVDLTMYYYNDFGFGEFLLAGQLSEVTVGYLRFEGGKLWLDSPVTRAPAARLSWMLPEGVEPEMIVRQPFVRVQNFLLMTVRLAEDSYAPLVLSLSGGSALGEARQADAMIPFWTVAESKDAVDKYEQIAGYAVSARDWTWMWSFDPASMTFQDRLFPNDATALSVVTYARNGETPEVCLLCDKAGERHILIYYPLLDSGNIITGVTCSEIVVAK